MNKMTKQNLHNIKDRFERETGAALQTEKKGIPLRRVLVLAVLVAMGVLLAAFATPLFSPLDGDELALEGTYLGDGIVAVRVENRSDKVLTITDAVLFSWNDGAVATLPGGQVVLTNTRVEAHGEGILTVDLSGAYDIAFLESTTPGKPKDGWYYLLLTNQSFLFGHDWMCSFSFGEKITVSETEPTRMPEGKARNINEIPEELRFYFERSYLDVVPAFNEANFTYQQKVEELLMRTPGIYIRPANVPFFLEEQELSVNQRNSSLDAYKRMVGGSFSGMSSDTVLQISAQSDTVDEPVPLIFFAVYETQAIQAENAFAFLCGRILSFDDLNKVYEKEGYTVFDVTDLFYSDLEEYLRDFSDDADCREWMSVRDYYRNPRNLEFYLLPSGS